MTNWFSQSGQLSHSTSFPRIDAADEPNPVMHSFYVHQTTSTLPASTDDSAVASTVLQRLNLSVGGTGVVGRTVSVLDEHRVLVGEGIIGWN
jgi:hypothetical protein